MHILSTSGMRLEMKWQERWYLSAIVVTCSLTSHQFARTTNLHIQERSLVNANIVESALAAQQIALDMSKHTQK